MAGENDGPLAGVPPMPREISEGLPGFQSAPSFLTEPPRATTKTSLTPCVSPGTRLDASDSKAIARAKRLSFEITPLVDGPLGRPPSIALEIRVVVWSSAREPALLL